jgi:signal transduction histidine kinase
MDDKKEGLLLIGTTTIILVAFLITILAVMIIYRKRKLDHIKELGSMNEKFARELLQSHVEMQQQTMQYIGREIHDNIGQKLTLATLYIRQFELDDAAMAEKAKSVASIIDESLAELRNLSKDLTSPSYLKENLYQLIQAECLRVQNMGGCETRLQSNALEITASLSVKNSVWRILQEFLQNSLKHADCTLIDVKIDQDDMGLGISVSDNGKGFLIPEMGDPNGIGLINMQKRAELIGAGLSLESSPGTGTKMHLQIPKNRLNH